MTQVAYRFESKPHPVSGPKYREGQPTHANIMYDRRVCRGRTVPHVGQAVSGPQEEVVRRPVMRNRNKKKYKKFEMADVDPVPGRQHIEIQTEQFLEEIANRPDEASKMIQTDPEINRPPTPLFIPKLTGVSVATEILPGDLFFFDKEVEPILELLVGQILDQSMTEVVREEELQAMRAYREELRNVQRTELAETRRLQQEERSRIAEKAQRVEQERARLRREQELKEKLEEQKFVRSFMHDVTKDTIGVLDRKGYFGDALMREVEVEFMPWLMSEAQTKISDLTLARRLVDDMIRHTLAHTTAVRAEACQTMVERSLMSQHDLKFSALKEAAKIPDASTPVEDDDGSSASDTDASSDV